MKYIKLFKNHSDYEAFKLSEDFVIPNVSYCILELEVHYNPLPIPVLGEVQVFHDKWCTEYAYGDENTVYVRLNRAFNVGQSKSWIGENGDLVVQTPDSLPAEDPFAVIVWTNLYSEGLAEPFSEGNVIECTNPGGGGGVFSSDVPAVIFYADGTSSTAPETSSKSLVVKYNVVDSSLPTLLYGFYNEEGQEEHWQSGADLFNKIKIDGAEVPISDLDAAEGKYQLSVGEHIVAYTLKDLTAIGNMAFFDCSSIVNVEIPSSVTSIGEGAFESCTGLTSIIISGSVTSIGAFAFTACSGLTGVTIGDSVTSIGASAFEGCTSLTSITIPNSVVVIGGRAFNACSKLESVTVNAIKPPQLYSMVFFGTNCPIYVPAESVDTYKAASNWSTYADRIQAISDGPQVTGNLLSIIDRYTNDKNPSPYLTRDEANTINLYLASAGKSTRVKARQATEVESETSEIKNDKIDDFRVLENGYIIGIIVYDKSNKLIDYVSIKTDVMGNITSITTLDDPE